MMSLRRRTTVSIFVIGIMIWIHGMNLANINSSTSGSTFPTHSSGPILKDEMESGLTRGNNSSVEDFEDNINRLAWSTSSSDIPNGTNERSNYDAYDGSTYSWRMDSAGTQPNLNELILHIGLVDVDSLYLSFATREYGSNNQDAMPAQFIGRSNCDGIAVSNDGESWYKLWQYPSDLASWTLVGSLDVLALSPEVEMDPKEDLYLKFQQYGSGNIPDDGILWDNITLLVNRSGQTIPDVILNVPEPETEANITNSVIYADGQSDNGTETTVVSITVTGKGEGLELSGEFLEIKYDIAGGLGMTDYGTPDINGDRYTWTKNYLVPDEVWVVSFTLHAYTPFNESIGPISFRYDSWDGDPVGWKELDAIHLKVRGVEAVEIEVDDGLGGSRIIANNPAGSRVVVSTRDQDGLPMPFTNFDWYLEMEDPTAAEWMEQPFENTARIVAREGTVGLSGRIRVVHIGTQNEYELSFLITWGPPQNIDVITVAPYIVGEQGVIAAQIYDDFSNAVEDYTGVVRMVVEQGDLVIDGGDSYEYTAWDRGAHTFIITPLTWGSNSTTVLFRDDTEGIESENITISAIAGPVVTLNISLDYERMEWEGPPDEYVYYAGEPFYLKIIGRDKHGNPSETYTKSLIVSHDTLTDGNLEPEPWQSQTGDLMFTMVNGVSMSPIDPDTPLKFFVAGKVTITVKSQVDHDIIGNFTIDVLPTYLDSLVAAPGGSESWPEKVDVILAGSQRFEIKGYDRYENEVPIDPEMIDWSVDSNINKIGEGTFMENSPVFNAVEYFTGPVQEGEIHVVTTGPRDATARLNIAVRVVNDKDVWITREQIEPTGVLVGEPLSLKANIHYSVPSLSLVGDMLEIKIRFSLVTDSGDLIVELVEKNMRLTNLNDRPQGIWTFKTTLPAESFMDFVNIDPDNNPTKNVNYMKVEILDAVGGADLSEFEITDENNQVTVGLFAVSIPGGGEKLDIDLADILTDLDLDEDGLDDGWEEYYFNGDGEPDGDPDNDGLTNIEEFRKETDPTKKEDGGDEDPEGFLGLGTTTSLLILTGLLLIVLVIIFFFIFVYRKKPPNEDLDMDADDDLDRVPAEFEHSRRDPAWGENDGRAGFKRPVPDDPPPPEWDYPPVSEPYDPRRPRM